MSVKAWLRQLCPAQISMNFGLVLCNDKPVKRYGVSRSEHYYASSAANVSSIHQLRLDVGQDAIADIGNLVNDPFQILGV